jgi:5-methylthioadenosine/S-adenosylhomocysteine deaminase
MSATLIRAAKIVTLNAADAIHAPGYLIITGGRITELGPLGALDPARRFDEVADLGRRLVMPGLVNAHTHSPMTLFRGMVEGHTLFTFEGWYNTIRVVEQVMDPGMLPAAVAVSCAEMIRTGTTTFADQYFWMDRIAPEVRKAGLRAALGYGIVELGDPAAREREIGAASDFLASLAGDPLLQGWVGPHAFFVDNSEEAMALELALADRCQTGLHFHLATSGEEDRYCREHYGRSAVAQMEAMGVLERRLLAAHGLTVPPEDFPTLAKYPFTIAAAPSSAMRNAAGFAPLTAMREAGVNLALGTDNVTNNNSYDMFKEMQLVGKVTAMLERRPNAFPTRAIVEMATLGGARALGLEDRIGSLEAGKDADLIALDLDEIGWAPTNSQDVITALVYSVTGQHVTDTMVAGRWLYRDGAFVTVDYAAACAALEEAVGELKEVMSDE